MKIKLTGAVSSDLDNILEMENNSDNRAFVAQWSRIDHEKALDNCDIKTLIIRDSATDRMVGYAILTGCCSAEKSVNLRRLVISEKGRGYGRAALEALKSESFETLGAHRLWLDVRQNNPRAKKLYESCGFVEEGLLRDAALVEGHYVSAFVMSVLEGEYRK